LALDHCAARLHSFSSHFHSAQPCRRPALWSTSRGMLNRIAGALRYSRSRGATPSGSKEVTSLSGSGGLGSGVGEAKRQRASSRDAVAGYKAQTGENSVGSEDFLDHRGSKKELAEVTKAFDGEGSERDRLSAASTSHGSSALQEFDRKSGNGSSKSYDSRQIEARQAEEKDFIRHHDTPEAHSWYLVDVQWLQEWKLFVTQKGPLPGPIDNSRLLERNGRPRAGLRPVDDYRGVNSAIWSFWHERYGGGPEVRRKQLDLYTSETDDLSSEKARSKRSEIPLPGTASSTRSTSRQGTKEMRQENWMGSTSASSSSTARPPAMTSFEKDARGRNADKADRVDATPAPTTASTGRSLGGSIRGKSVPAVRGPARAVPEVEGPPKKVCCDKCDGPHPTDDCPHFKKAREKHADAWSSLGKKIKAHCCENVPIVRSARVVQQPGDGSCLFHSLSYGLSDRSNASSLRRDICGFISKNPDMTISDTTLKDWIKYDSNDTVQAYSNRMSGQTWGGGIEMAALTRLKGVNVHVYEKVPEGFRRISDFDCPGSSKIVNILYKGRMHYDALVI